MSHGRFALSMAGGMLAVFLLSAGLALLLEGVWGSRAAWFVGMAVAGGLGSMLGAWLVRSGDARRVRRDCSTRKAST